MEEEVITGVEQEHESVNQLLQDVTKLTEEKPEQKENPFAKENIANENTDNAESESEPKKATSASAKTEADLYIMLANFGQQKINGGWLKRKAESRLTARFGEDAMLKLETARELKERGETITNSDQIAMLRLDKHVSEILETLPFTEAEKEQIREPLTEMIKENGGVMPAWLRLTVAGLMIIGARTFDVKMF